MAYRLTKLHSMLTVASLTSQTRTYILMQSSTSKISHFSGQGRSISPGRNIFQGSSNPRIFSRSLKSAPLSRPEYRLRISDHPLIYPVFFSPETPKPGIKPSIDPKPSYPIPGEADTSPGIPPEPPVSPDPLQPEVHAKPEVPPSPDPTWPSELPQINPSPQPEIFLPGRETTDPTKPPMEVPLKTTDIRDPPMNPPGTPPPDIVPPIRPPGIPPDIPPNPPPDVPPNPPPYMPPFPNPTPPDPFPPIPTPPIMRDWPLPPLFPWMQIININIFSLNGFL